MAKAGVEFIETIKRVKQKRDRLFIVGCILLLLSGGWWLFSVLQLYNVDTLYTMAMTDPVDILISAGNTAIEGQFATIGNVVDSYLSYIVPFLVLLMFVVGGVAIVRSDASFLVILMPIIGVIFSTTILRDDEPKALPEPPTVRTASLIPAGDANALLRAITEEYPGAGLILKDAMEKGGSDSNAVTALEGEMRQGYNVGNARRAMSMSVALVQALIVAAEHTSDKAESKKLQVHASRVAALSIRILRDLKLVKIELAYRLYELAQRSEPGIENIAKPEIEMKITQSAKMVEILRGLKGIFLMMSAILIVLAGFANKNLRVLKQINTEA
ncbi:TPA: hypothetical protein RG501_RS13165 [Providencia rettgeri]|nr:hypothetical protein [Providencia rettgeri]